MTSINESARKQFSPSIVRKPRLRNFRLPRLFSPKPHLSDHLARDIGIQTAEQDQQRTALPSQDLRHPML